MNKPAPDGLDYGDEKAFRVAYLVAGFIRHTLTDAEQIELDVWVTANMDNQRLFEKMIDEKNIARGMEEMKGIDTEAALKAIKAKIQPGSEKKKAVVRSVWIYAAAAAVLLAVMAFFIWTTNKPKHSSMQDMVKAQSIDLVPGSNRASLTLADGRIVSLDTLQTGKLVAQGNANITKLDSGQLVYGELHPGGLPQAASYNELNVPAGGQYKIVLPDGTKVWLNAASSLRYPTVFGGSKRIVELKGEAYFEVAKDPMYPFEVKADGVTIQVLGTHFNVNAYGDEPAIKVVLAEGSVRLSQHQVLAPGEAGSVDKEGNIKITKTDVESTIAWKNGRFIFKETAIDVLMRQVARWYNAEIVYEGTTTEHFNADISRDEPVSKLLELLEGTGKLHFKIAAKKITVMK